MFNGNPFPNNGNGDQQRWSSSNAGTSFSFGINPPQPGRYDVNVNWNQHFFSGQGQVGERAFKPCMPMVAPATEEMLKTTGKDQGYNRPPTPYHSPPPAYSFVQASPNVSGFPASTEIQGVASGPVGGSVGQPEALKNKKTAKKTAKVSLA